MPITINGSGTVTGISAGGLPDACITAAELDGAQSGSAPIYAARAWVNFNGTGTVAIRSSGNVSSITDNGTGDYTVNFTTAMPDANYSPAFGIYGGRDISYANAGFSLATGSFRFGNWSLSTAAAADNAQINVAIFR